MNHCLPILPILLSCLLSTVTVVFPLPCYGASCKLVMTGTGPSIEVMKIMAKAFRKKHPAAEVEVLPSIGSTGGIKSVLAGKVDIGLTSRPLKPDEKSQYLEEAAYGRTAFIFAVQSSNPEKGLSLKEIEDIYAQRKATWRNDQPLRLVLRPQADAYSVYLSTISPRMKTALEKAHSVHGCFVGVTDQDAANQIERTPGGFGVTSACLVAAEKRQIKALAVNGVTPTLSNVKSGSYPYTMRMYVVYRKNATNPLVEQFTEFIFSPRGRKVLEQTAHIPLKRDSER